MKTAAIVLFALMYVLMIARPKYRPFYALAVAVIFLITGILPRAGKCRKRHEIVAGEATAYNERRYSPTSNRVKEGS